MPDELGTRRLDLLSASFRANPYPTYAWLRAESPVVPTRLPDGRNAWLVTRYQDVALVLKDPRLAKDRRRVTISNRMPIERFLGPLVNPLQFNMLDMDPPDHTRLRALVHQAFTPRLIERLRERITVLADELMERAAQRGEFDLVADYALPIPATIIADLLGVPASDRARFHRWSSRIVRMTSSRDALAAMPALLLFMRYLKRLFARRRAEPRDDLITALVQVEQAGTHLSSDELLSMAFLLLVAGHETTVNLIGAGALALLDQPEQMERLRSEPHLLERGPAVEELLRYTSPVQIATERYALEQLVLSGVTIPYGAFVLGVIGSANHDEHQFTNPEQLDLGRTPNQHLAFGQGVHYCLGAPLARLEGQIGFETLLRKLPRFELAISRDAVVWKRGIFLRGPEGLPIRVRPSARVAA
jgi:cytochrome P450 PksS